MCKLYSYTRYTYTQYIHACIRSYIAVIFTHRHITQLVQIHMQIYIVMLMHTDLHRDTCIDSCTCWYVCTHNAVCVYIHLCMEACIL